MLHKLLIFLRKYLPWLVLADIFIIENALKTLRSPKVVLAALAINFIPWWISTIASSFCPYCSNPPHALNVLMQKRWR